MKSKSVEQMKEREAHKERVRKTPLLNRKQASIPIKQRLLIVCEGKNTEPSYFQQFRLTTATIIPVGVGKNTESLVNCAINLRRRKKYDQVWCVFDKDDFSDLSYNSAIELAERNNMKVASSNQAFEYWLILHFEDHQGGLMSRMDYGKKIERYLKPFGVTYDFYGSKSIDSDFFTLLSGIDKKSGEKRVNLALKRAKAIDDRCSHENPAKEESSTKVFLLVEEILKYV